jgi:hypothetical protein
LRRGKALKQDLDQQQQAQIQKDQEKYKLPGINISRLTAYLNNNILKLSNSQLQKKDDKIEILK